MSFLEFKPDPGALFDDIERKPLARRITTGAKAVQPDLFDAGRDDLPGQNLLGFDPADPKAPAPTHDRFGFKLSDEETTR